MIKKIAELRTKVDGFILKHLMIMGFITITCICPWVADVCEWTMDKLEDFFYGPLDMTHSNAEQFAETIVVYCIIIGSYKFINWSAKYIVKAIRNHRASKEVSE